MAIRVIHQPSAASFGAAYATGYGMRQQRQQKYALDMWQRERLLQQRLGALGYARGTRRGAAQEPGGLWVDPLTENRSLQDFPGNRVIQRAQMRRAERWDRMGKGETGGNLLPYYQSAEEIKALQDQQEAAAEQMQREQWRAEQWEHEAEMKKTPFELMQPGQQQETIQGFVKGITADPAEGMPAYSDTQQRQSRQIMQAPGLSPLEKYTALKQLFLNPEGEPKQDVAQQWRANTRPWDMSKLDFVPEGTEGPNIVRMPVKNGEPNMTLFDALQKAQQQFNNPPSVVEAKKAEEKKAADLEKLKTQQLTAQSKLNAAILKKSTSAKPGVTLSDEAKKALQSQIDLHKQQVKDIQEKIFDLEGEGQAAAAEIIPAPEFTRIKEGETPEDLVVRAFSEKWKTLKPGETLMGPDGQMYMKGT